MEVEPVLSYLNYQLYFNSISTADLYIELHIDWSKIESLLYSLYSNCVHYMDDVTNKISLSSLHLVALSCLFQSLHFI